MRARLRAFKARSRSESESERAIQYALTDPKPVDLTQDRVKSP